MLAYVDEILLKDINVDRNSEEYIAVKDKLIYGENHEDLTATEKAEKLAEHENKLKVAGYRTEQDVQDYFDLEYRRTVYAKEAYKKYIADKGYSEKELEAGYLEMNASKYNDSVNAIVVTFDSEEEAFSKEHQKVLRSEGWVATKVNDQWHDFCGERCRNKYIREQTI